jgi:nucleotide-binding universal stress UspA family protein
MNSKLFATNRVLIPIDFSEASLQAQELTLDFVKNPSHLHVLHVIPHLNPGEPGIIWNRLDDETRKQHVYQLFKQRFNRSEYEQVHFSVAVGDPVAAIVSYAKEQKIDLIVVPSHKRTGLSHFFQGSVAEKVIRLPPCPVLVLGRENLLASRE